MRFSRSWPCLAVLPCLLAASCAPPKSELDQIRERGELRVVTRNGPTTYFNDRDGDTGIEYEMARRFAMSLGVRLKIMVAESNRDIFNLVSSGQADLAAAGLTQRNIEAGSLAPGRGYHWITWQVVYRNGGRLPASLDDIAPDMLHLADDSLQVSALKALHATHPSLSWYVHAGLDSDDLIDMVEDGRIAYTVLPSNELAHIRQIRPEIRAALNLTAPRPLAWGVRRSEDTTLLRAADDFIANLERSGQLGKLLDRFYGPVESFDYVDSREFMDRLRERLPRYRALFERVADEFDIDWRLLAAISYQESHWDTGAQSPTGVRGLMMLTEDTAQRVGIRDRLDPEQSLRGGAKYLKQIGAMIPARIPDPDRTWLTLAAYNIGFGHLEDARILTQRQGDDPDDWQRVRERLPLLSHPAWYERTRRGYARGWEPVRYVQNIEKYYSMLVQATQPESVPEQVVDADPSTQAPL